ncbi:hypothetical protein HNE_2122 [Hyphomonas neptunium ATCC 15444]|uniref:Uncharacterized protein n=2 Tax=Hyphomonas TaxID=85 RepID=Q0C0C4_HYPNA|nr:MULTISPECIES: hypothetical protein [Hyphomonas]ABI76186.1 hypothetical protein HNE_2122 [Hyphomonas neptunium ATCC 15444]KCZ90600.1 hypothetical protein HHI_13715 [Hyphomonas hirschiana VP5]
MTWFVSLVMFWVGVSFGFVLGAWWVAAHTREREMDERCCRDGPSDREEQPLP